MPLTGYEDVAFARDTKNNKRIEAHPLASPPVCWSVDPHGGATPTKDRAFSNFQLWV